MNDNEVSVFCNVPEGPIIEVTALSEECQSDKCRDKVNLTLGVFRTFDGRSSRIPVVEKVEIRLANDENANKDYLPITGLPSFCKAGVEILLGKDHIYIPAKIVDSVQTVGGSGAVYLAAQFLRKILKYSVVYISDPSWPSHRGICTSAGFDVREYRYWDNENNELNFEGLLEDLRNATVGSVVILHPCAHNPTGMDLNSNQWQKLANIMKEKRLFPLFDIAYQGFVSGDLDEDAYVIRMFLDNGFELFAAQSFSKNFGLYNDRVGNLVFVTKDPLSTAHTKSQLLILARYCWSNPPNHGALIVSTVLNDPELTREWRSNLREMAERIMRTRHIFYEKLVAHGTPGCWENIIKQRGMFSYTGLSREQTEYLRKHFHIYMTSNGRINMCGLNESNIDYVANAFCQTLLRGVKGDAT